MVPELNYRFHAQRTSVQKMTVDGSSTLGAEAASLSPVRVAVSQFRLVLASMRGWLVIGGCVRHNQTSCLLGNMATS